MQAKRCCKEFCHLSACYILIGTIGSGGTAAGIEVSVQAAEELGQIIKYVPISYVALASLTVT